MPEPKELARAMGFSDAELKSAVAYRRQAPSTAAMGPRPPGKPRIKPTKEP
jgi:hypothetical protein